jgi:nucleoprotein TPR
MAATVNPGFIAATYSIPESDITTLLDAPTVDLVQSLLRQLEKKARDYQAQDAEKLRSDVELDTVIRSSEARARQLKDTVDKSSKEIELLRKQLSEEGMCHICLLIALTSVR